VSISIHGKEYSTVEERVQLFRKAHPDWTISTELIHHDDISVVVRASIATPEGTLVATGHAEETRAASRINQTSALENCETSAVGRALAFLGLSGSGSIASADELLKAAVNDFAQAEDLGALKHRYASWFAKLKNTDAAPRLAAAKDARKKELANE